MPNPSQAAFLEALGWTLLNSWWQFGILWVLYLFLKKVLPRLTASHRYSLSLLFLVSGMGWAVVSFLLRFTNLLENGYHLGSYPNDELHGVYATISYWIQFASPYISVVYLVWLGVRLLQFSKILYVTGKIRTQGLRKAPVEWRLFLNKMCGQMNIRSVQFWLSDKIDTPLILGWLKPMILLPVSAINQLTPEQLEAILIHELAHIKRNDYFWNLVVAIAEVIFFYNPFARNLVAAIREEREHSCDDWVLQFPFSADQYAYALLKLEQQRTKVQSQLLLAARGSHRNVLLIRVQRMLNLPVSPQRNMKMAVLAGFTGIVCLFALVQPQREIRQLIRNVVSPLASRENGEFIRTVRFDPKAAEAEKASYDRHVVNLSPARAAATVPAAMNTTGLDAGQLYASGLIDARLNGSELNGSNNTANNHAINGVTLVPTADWVTIEEEKSDYAPANNVVVEDRSFSLPEKELVQPMDVLVTTTLPYVPRNSFQAGSVDTTVPATVKGRVTLSVKAKEAAVQAQMALEQLDWEKLKIQLEVKGKTPEAIQLELEKALAQVDWNKVQQDASRAVKQLEKQLSDQKMQLEQHLRSQQDYQRQLQRTQEREYYRVNDDCESKKKETKKATCNKKKVVYL